jgi:hypothetical protein
MSQFSMFVTYVNQLTNETRKTGPILLEAESEREASVAARAVADFAFSLFPFSVLVQVLGDDAGHPIAEIRRPLSI